MLLHAVIFCLSKPVGQLLVTVSAGKAYCYAFANPVCPSYHIRRVLVWPLCYHFASLGKDGTLLGSDDSRRPWVRLEKERFKSLLEINGLPVQEYEYFGGVEPTLLMHFEVIQAMRRGQSSV